MSRFGAYPDGYNLLPGDRLLIERQGQTYTIRGAAVVGAAASAEQFDQYKRETNERIQALTTQNYKLINLVEAATGAPILALGTLYLSSTAYTAGTMFNATISGATPGSTITATANDGTVLSVVGALLSGTFNTAGSKTITLTEELAGYFNSPNPTQFVASVADGGVITPPTPGTLTATPATASIAANAAAGTLISNIGNVPAGVTPTVTPNDGRFVIAGDATNGWKVVTGMSALSAGSVSLTVAATGATSVGVAVTITGVVAPAQPKPMIAVTNQRFPDASRTIAASESVKQRSIHQFGFDCNSITVLVPTARRTPASPFPEVALTTPITLTKMSVQIGNTVVPVTFAGSRTATIVNDGTNAWIESDPIPASAFNLTAFARDAVIYPKYILTNSSTTDVALPNGQPSGQFGTRYVEYPAGTSPTDDIDVAGGISSTGGTAYDIGYPVFIKATPLAAGAASIAHIDDSIGVGFSESWDNTQSVMSGYGYFNRALLDGGGLNAIAGINMTRATSTMNNWNASHAFQDKFLSLVNVVSFKHMTNDFSSSGATIDLAGAQARVATLIAAAKARGVQKIVAVSPPPRHDATGGGTTTAPNAGWGPGGAPDQYIQWLRSGAGGQIDGLFDLRAAVGDPGNQFIFASGMGAGDRLHMSTTGHVTGGLGLRQIYQGLVLDGVSGGSQPARPSNLSVPTISGTAQEGQVLTASNGTWSGSPTGYTYQWNRNGAAISGSTAMTRTLTTADVGATITVSVIASNTAGASTAATSAPTTAVAAAGSPVPVNTAAPVISGGTAVGSTLTTTNGTWDNNPTSYTYQWRADGVNIAGATNQTYVTQASDAGKTITCRVSATNAGGSTPAVSNGITVVGASGGTVFLNDSFTEAAATGLNSHTPETGGAWSRVTAINSGNGRTFVGGGTGRLYSTPIPDRLVNAAVPPSANYDIEMVLQFDTTAGSTMRRGIVFRAEGGASVVGYELRFADFSSKFELLRYDAANTGGITLVSSATYTKTNGGGTAKVLVTLRGSVITAYLNDSATPMISFDDTTNAITAAGFVGVSAASQNDTATTGFGLTSLKATSV